MSSHWRFFRHSLPVVLVGIWPAVILFILAVRPARLYAESSIDAASQRCGTPDPLCVDAAAGASCSGDRVCIRSLSSCLTDGGTREFPLSCGQDPAIACHERSAPCVGKSAGDECGAGARCRKSSCILADGGIGAEELACDPTAPPPPPPPSNSAGGTPDGSDASSSNASDGGCSTTSAPTGALSAIGLFAAFSLFVRLRRRLRRA